MVTRRLLDTDTFSHMLIGRELVATRARVYLQEVGELSISVITFYEALRGLKYSNAQAKLAAFERLYPGYT